MLGLSGIGFWVGSLVDACVELGFGMPHEQWHSQVSRGILAQYIAEPYPHMKVKTQHRRFPVSDFNYLIISLHYYYHYHTNLKHNLSYQQKCLHPLLNSSTSPTWLAAKCSGSPSRTSKPRARSPSHNSPLPAQRSRQDTFVNHPLHRASRASTTPTSDRLIPRRRTETIQ